MGQWRRALLFIYVLSDRLDATWVGSTKGTGVPLVVRILYINNFGGLGFQFIFQFQVIFGFVLQLFLLVANSEGYALIFLHILPVGWWGFLNVVIRQLSIHVVRQEIKAKLLALP